MDIGRRIEELRKQNGMTLEELGNKVGVGKSTVRKWENGMIANMRRDKIAKIASALGVSPASLMGWNEETKRPAEAVPIQDSLRIPLLGSVAAGQPLFDEGNVIGEVLVDPAMAAGDQSLYALKVRGDSMSPKILDGDTVIVREQPDAENGEIVIVTVNGEEGTCKKLQRYPDTLALVSLNPVYEPIVYTWEEVEQLPVRIVGKVIQSRHDF
jgi:repressor LexA